MALLALVVLCWGLSWYAITLQIGDVPALVSIAWRFGIAGVTLQLWLIARGRVEPLPRRLWSRTALLGVCLFGANFVCFYHATAYVASGLVAIVFAMAVFMNALNQWLWHRVVPERRALLGAAFGVSGIALVFAPSIEGAGSAGGASMATGLGLALLGTWFFSAGNLVSASLARESDLPNTIARAMLVGAGSCAVLAVLRGESLALPLDAHYLGALLYLAIVASVIAFVAYLTFVAREGPIRAGYATVLFPIVALGVSTFAEGYEWSAASIVGVTLALGGAGIVFARPAAYR